ncbi:hypothetical protein HIM_03671 [Hirsutella minnesotensis 3608]|uniref:FAD-binding FR-type domain-containing protein n=1 Tax=Hirsutella minnesotensis 3608 TaxID=1043627 RepID=A0A0F8A6B6_9HYPO|nr:hypothetical protein HIM_03671 [Hirsutella minnesotensis 3608]
MGWPYELMVDLSAEDKLLRRQNIDFYACLAHYSALTPALAYLLWRLACRALARGTAEGGRGDYQEVPHSPTAKAHRGQLSGRFEVRWRQLCWWAQDDVSVLGMPCGRRDEWLLGFAWFAWLLCLCVVDTGKDYLHLTKRFGAIAVSQLPIQFLMALKVLNPYAFAFKSSHEDINRYHRVLGRIIYALLLLHVLFYNYFFVAAGIWLNRFFAPIVFCGVVANMALNALVTTSLIKDYSYRIFFITHLTSATAIPVLIFFHAPSTRLYLVETLVVLFLDIGVRKVSTITAPSKLELVPGTDLVKVTSAIPAHRLGSFKFLPGSHILLNVPAGSRSTTTQGVQSGTFNFLYNPFTVASVDEDDGITVVTRVRQGPVTLLLGKVASTSPAETGKIPLAIEGPYGTIGKNFNDLLGWGAARILLVAGGIGATFTLPVHQAIKRELPSAKVQLVWAVRGADDAAWAAASLTPEKDIHDNEEFQLYVTGSTDATDGGNGASTDNVEMDSLSHKTTHSQIMHHVRRGRPDLERIINATFRHGLEEPVAVLVCGPTGMTREVRRRVRPWAMRGRKIWWHAESFGW